jgi:cation:H+ antiporter
MVSVTAMQQGQPMIAIGNVLGSYVANICLVLGVTGLIRPISVSYIILHRQIPFGVAALILLVVLSLGAYVDRLEIGLLLALLCCWLVWLVCHVNEDENVCALPRAQPLGWAMFGFLIGALVLQAGAYLLVAAAASIAQSMGVSPYVVGLSIVAVGTSLPELASGVYGALHGEFELVLSNVLGANILLILFVLPVVFYMSPYPIVLSDSWGDYLFMSVASVLLWLFSTRFDRAWQINRAEALSLVCLFIAYQVFVYR